MKAIADRQLIHLLTWRETGMPIRTPRLRRSGRPSIVAQWLMLRWLKVTKVKEGEWPDQVFKEQVWKLLVEGASPVAIRYIKEQHELLKTMTPKGGHPVVQAGRPDSSRRRH